MNHLKIREEFFNFFRTRKHEVLQSSSLVPQNDPSLLFVNAGMNPFKNIFLGLQKPKHQKVVSIQKCLRVGGKHNDLEQVGHSPFHHTFFEMMGNFSFGDYFKEEAIWLAWTFLTENLAIPKEKLWVSVFEEDQESYLLWKEKQKIPSDRIFKSGEENNFWRMGSEGPCGPCSEIYYYEGDQPSSLEDMTEIWNLVFMEFYEDLSGKKSPLPKPCVDTGVGLERLSSVLQSVPSNYQTDLFSPIIHALEEASQTSYKKNPAPFQVIADHGRAVAFLICDGILPGNEGQNYVLRRILRRAFHYNKKLNLKKNLIEVSVKEIISQMGSVYPELKKEETRIQNLIETEKEKFFTSLEQGQKIFLKKMESFPKKTITAPIAWDLYSTYGFPFDLTRLIAKEKGYKMELSSEEEMFQQNQSSSFKKESSKTDKLTALQLKKKNIKIQKTIFTGYETGVDDSVISQILSLKTLDTLSSLNEGKEAWCVFTQTCFYPEGGGQIGDRGFIQTSSAKASVLDCQTQEGMIFHKVKVLKGTFKPKDKIKLTVNKKHRRLTSGSHSATHLLHSALRKILGPSVRQAGSLVEAGRLRFDFSHHRPLTKKEIKTIEQAIQNQIEDCTPVTSSILPYKEALKKGALSMAGENYPEKVRVIQMEEHSHELCGGVHVSNTSEIGNFKIISETGVQSGIRRIEAYTGTEAFKWLNHLTEQNLELRDYFKIPYPKKIEFSSLILDKIKRLEDELKLSKEQLKNTQSSQHDWEEIAFNKSSLFILKSSLNDRKLLADIADKKKSQKSSVVIVFGKSDSHYPVIVSVSKDLQQQISAHEILKTHLTPILEGKGGGQPRFAQGEVKSLKRLKEVQESLIKNFKNESH